MAKIPSFGNLQLKGNESKLFNSGASAADGLRSVGEGLNSIANLALQKKLEDDQLQYQRALLELDAFGNEELNHPDKGYLNQKGENALKTAGEYDKRYTDKIAELRQGLGNNAFLDKFNLQSQGMLTSHQRQLLIHESKAQSALALETLQSGIDLALNNAESLYQDSTSLMMTFNNISSRMEEFSTAQGMPREQQEAQKFDFSQKYFSSALDGWIAHTKLTNGSFTDLSSQMKQSLAFNKLTEINQSKYLLKLEGLIKKQDNINKDDLNLDLTNAWAMQQRGITAPSIPLERFEAVLGDKGRLAYEDFEDKQIMAQNINSMQHLNYKDLSSFTKEDISMGEQASSRLTARVGEDNFNARLKIQSVQNQAAKIIIKQRSEDPIGSAIQAGEIDELDLSLESLSKRVIQASRISQHYQTPLRILSNVESAQLSKIIDESGYTQQGEILKVLASSTEDDNLAFEALMQDIGHQNPAFAVAGQILNSPGARKVTIKHHWFRPDEQIERQAVSNYILKGADALKPLKGGDSSLKGISLPDKWIEAFNIKAGDYFTDDFESKIPLQSVVMNYYVGKSISIGKYAYTQELDEDLLEESINVVIGKRSNKFDVRMPWGFSEQSFTNEVESQYRQIIKANGWGESDLLKQYGYDPNDVYQISRMSLEDRFTLVPSSNSSGLPDGKYFIKAGNRFLINNSGDPVVIDVLESSKSIKEIPE